VRFWAALGFGFCEVGSVTARESSGNPQPRAFRLPEDRALVNRMGLNNAGAAAVAARLAALPRRAPLPFPLGVNVAKTHDPAILGGTALDDFAQGVHEVAPFADYLALNVSCPNTAEGKTFEEPDALDALLGRVMRVRAEVAPELPVLIKLSPPPLPRARTSG
jgi:dihydroorotate dehydrogenase